MNRISVFIRKYPWLAKIICKIFGCIYPEKKLPTDPLLIKMFPKEHEDPRVGAYVADLSKPCARCGENHE